MIDVFVLGVFLIACGFLFIWSDRKQYRAWGKRMFDIVLGTFLFFLFLPVTIVVSIVVLFDTGWPIIFTQQRVGRGLKRFNIFKFHTLQGTVFQKHRSYKECEEASSKTGKFLRHHVLDELPQFLNVIKGDMSLVGNRPSTPDYFERNIIGPETQKALYVVKPGLTGFVQIACHKHNCDDPESVVKYGLAYVREYSLWVDLKVIFQTVSILFRGR